MLDEIAPASPRDAVDARLSLVLSIESALQVLRYLIVFLLVGLYALDIHVSYMPDLWPIALAVFAQNAFVHWVLYTQRYILFVSPFNFLFHLFALSLAVGSTGGEESPLALVYVLFIIGYCIYEPHFLNAMSVTMITCSAYAFTVLGRWLVEGVNLAYPPIGLQISVIFLSGLLIRALGGLLRRMRIEAQSQAQALASSRATIRAILDSTPEPILVYDDNEFISDVNERGCEFFGVSRTQLLGERFRSYLFDDGTLPNRLANLRARGEYHGEVLVITPSGEERNVSLRVRSFIRTEQRFFVAIMHDITQQKNLQEAARLATMRLEQINRELQQVNQLRRAFFNTLSQRIRSPLSAILGFCDLLLNDELGEVNEDQRHAVQGCRRSAQRILALVDEPFALTASNEGAGPGGDAAAARDDRMV